MTKSYLKFRKVEDDEPRYAVMWGSQELGEVYYDSSAWKGYRWFILGERRPSQTGFCSDRIKKPSGYYTRKDAARKLAVMSSALIIKEECAGS